MLSVPCRGHLAFHNANHLPTVRGPVIRLPAPSGRGLRFQAKTRKHQRAGSVANLAGDVLARVLAFILDNATPCAVGNST